MISVSELLSAFNSRIYFRTCQRLIFIELSLNPRLLKFQLGPVRNMLPLATAARRNVLARRLNSFGMWFDNLRYPGSNALRELFLDLGDDNLARQSSRNHNWRTFNLGDSIARVINLTKRNFKVVARLKLHMSRQIRAAVALSALSFCH